ncbi:hypothetical protein B566_EDAN004573 [Ephemera danica]|nr:hypothetical protein B566_EDAN004573 [Ephemera danica]
MRPVDVINYRLQSCLSYPVYQRCDELTRLINETNSKDLKDAFPIILESIFSVPGWGLRSIDKTSCSMEGEFMLRFLDPMGPLFMLAYQLGTDYFLKYQLSLSVLPPKLQRDLESGTTVSTLFCEKLSFDPHTRRPNALLLSPFELLIFSYGLHVLPKLQPEVWVNSLYITLTERLLCHFLPCDPQAPSVLPHVPYMAQANQCSPAPMSFAQHTSPSKQSSTLSILKPSLALNFSSNSTSSAASSQNPLMEIWRTRIVAQVLLHLWLSVEDQSKSSQHPHTRSSYLEAANNQSLLSSVEHARIVRCLIKHFHYFANSACYTKPTAMDEMKRQILPLSKIQIYKYITYTMNNWPLDTSFRVILEAWLSYIQPWRYTNINNYSRQENDESGRPVDPRWQMFIAEHLPAYSYVFRQLLQRLQRMDLACLSNTLMLHRLTKVFSLGNMKQMVLEVEESLTTRPNGSSFGMTESNFSLTDATVAHTLEASPQIRLQAVALKAIADFEGQDTKYVPLFGTDTMIKVRAFVEDNLAAAQRRADHLAKEQALQKSRSSGFWNWFLGTNDGIMEEYTLEDRQRVVQILQHASDQLCSIFEITDVADTLNENSTLNASQQSSSSAHLNTTFLLNESSYRSSMWNSICEETQKEGHPDKKLIATSEVAWLVRMFHDISCHVNLQYGEDLQLMYARPDMVGRLARQVLQPPCSYFVYERGSQGYKTRCEKMLPARLSLRGFAKKKLLVWLSILCALIWLLGFHPVMGLLLPAFIYMCIVGVRALME